MGEVGGLVQFGPPQGIEEICISSVRINYLIALSSTELDGRAWGRTPGNSVVSPASLSHLFSSRAVEVRSAVNDDSPLAPYVGGHSSLFMARCSFPSLSTQRVRRGVCAANHQAACFCFLSTISTSFYLCSLHFSAHFHVLILFFLLFFLSRLLSHPFPALFNSVTRDLRLKLTVVVISGVTS